MANQIPRLMRCLTFGSLFWTLHAPAAVHLIAEDWESGNTNQWNSWGYPLPTLNSTSSALGNYSADPNGDGSYHSGLVSQQMYSFTDEIRLSIDAYIESASAWSELEFGIINTNSIPTNPNTSQYTVATLMIDADTQNTGHKLYASFVGSGGSQTITQHESASALFNGWHTYSFSFAADGSATISIDDQTVFSTDTGIFNYSNESTIAVMLAGRSYSSTNNLYDSVELTQIPEVSSSALWIGAVSLCSVGLWRRQQAA
jgi:hypothetical protein